MTTIFLISKVGPEWSEPVEAWYIKKEAVAAADKLQAELGKSKAVHDTLSTYTVKPINLKGNKP